MLLPCQGGVRFERVESLVSGGFGQTAFDRAYAGLATATRDGPPERELAPRAAPAEPFALHGVVLTPDRALDDGYVIVGDGDSISAVAETRPADVPTLDTNGVILPGLLDLHNHPDFNVFSAWEPPTRFANRYEWRRSDVYQRLIRTPENTLLDALPAQTQLRYAEIRALVGGVTAMQGAGGPAAALQEESLVRNLDKWIFGEQIGRSMIDLPLTANDKQLQDVLAGIGNGKVRGFYIHLAEGQSADPTSQQEFTRLCDLSALTSSTLIIHGTALTRQQFGAMKDAGAKLVWSPQSNLRLYGETTKIADALDVGVPVALGADWLPSGSTSLLAEMKVARRVLAGTGRPAEPSTLVAMATSGAAAIAGLDGKLGLLAPGTPADVLVLDRRHDDPWENVLLADPSWVELVVIGGDLAYGRSDWMTTHVDADHVTRLEPLLAWGKQMLLDTSYAARPGQDPPPTLVQLRQSLIENYPQTGPIFA